MEWICAGAGLWVFLAVVGLLALAGLVILLLKLGVIVHYAAKPEDSGSDVDYDLHQSREADEKGTEPDHE